MAHPVGLAQREVDRVRAGRVMTDQPHLAKLERVEHGAQLALMLRAVEGTWLGALRTAIAQPIHRQHPAGASNRASRS